MKLRIKFPFAAYLSAATPEQLDPATEFSYSGYQIQLSFEGHLPLTLSSGEEPHFRPLTHLLVVVDDLEFQAGANRPATLLRSLVQPLDPNRLLDLLTAIINRINRGIRNFGLVPRAAEIQPTEDQARSLLRQWETEFSEDGANWESVFPPSVIPDFTSVFLGNVGDHDALSISYWPDIEEAIQEDLRPGPEQEFVTNSLDHMRQGNLRLALMEAVVCLQIVLNQFLREHFTQVRNYSREKLDRVLDPGVPLVTRVGLLLDLLLPADDRKATNLELVIKALRWWEELLHTTGHLPEAIGREEFEACVREVLELAKRLGQQRDMIIAAPELKGIAAHVSRKFGVPLPEIQVRRRHDMIVRFHIAIASATPSADEMLRIVGELAESFRQRDRKFNDRNHLVVGFTRYPNETIAMWMRGGWSVLKVD